MQDASIRVCIASEAVRYATRDEKPMWFLLAVFYKAAMALICNIVKKTIMLAEADSYKKY